MSKQFVPKLYVFSKKRIDAISNILDEKDLEFHDLEDEGYSESYSKTFSNLLLDSYFEFNYLEIINNYEEKHLSLILLAIDDAIVFKVENEDQEEFIEELDSVAEDLEDHYYFRAEASEALDKVLWNFEKVLQPQKYHALQTEAHGTSKTNDEVIESLKDFFKEFLLFKKLNY